MTSLCDLIATGMSTLLPDSSSHFIRISSDTGRAQAGPGVICACHISARNPTRFASPNRVARFLGGPLFTTNGLASVAKSGPCRARIEPASFGHSWAGALKLSTPDHQAVLHRDGGFHVSPDGSPDIEITTDTAVLCRLIAGVLQPREAYLENLLSVTPRYTDEVDRILARLFPPLKHMHPADDLW
ncbi:MAG: hypothetical protein O3B73_02435 [bacterium]|jgi:hypothetical protein|nr:hypothetical protein [bacterium]